MGSKSLKGGWDWVFAGVKGVPCELAGRVSGAPVVPRRSPAPGWFLQRDQLLLTGPTSYGDRVAADSLVRPGFSARTAGETVIVRYPRTGLLREGVGVVVPLAMGGALRGLVGG
jgi:hypothetical protein